MKSILALVALLLVQSSLVQSVRYYRQERDLCSVGEDSTECEVDKGSNRKCRKECGPDEYPILDSKSPLCKGNCVCCSKEKDFCNTLFKEAYCSTGACVNDEYMIVSIFDLCRKGRTCCKPIMPKSHGALSHVNHTKAPNTGSEKGIGSYYETFDSLGFTYSSSQPYVLVEEKSEKEPNFHVHAYHSKTANGDGKSGAYLNCLEVHYYNTTVILKNPPNITESADKVIVNGDTTELTSDTSYPNGMKIDRDKNQHNVVVDLPDKLTLSYNGKGKVVIKIDESMEGKVWGILGNSNGDKTDDLQFPLKNGGIHQFPSNHSDPNFRENLNTFFEAWFVEPNDKCGT